jgi:site-specific recombinase XerD
VPLVMSCHNASVQYLDHCQVQKGLSSHSIRAYRGDLAAFARFVGRDTPVGALDRESIHAFVRYMQQAQSLQPATVRRRVACLRAHFRWLEKEELVAADVFHRLDVAVPLPRRLPRSLETEEVRSLLRSCNLSSRTSHDDLMLSFAVIVLFITGVRIGELLGLMVRDLSLRDGALMVRGKGNRERRVFVVGREATLALAKYLKSREGVKTTTESLFVTSRGAAPTAQLLRRRLREFAARVGIRRRVTPHMLRHTAATQLLEAGVDIRFVQRLLGHSTISTTQLYTDVRDNVLRGRVAEANTYARLLSGG